MKNYKVIVSSCVANIFEWYDYTLFIYYAVIITDKFFPTVDKSVVLLQSFLIFAIGYLMRPIGGIFFGIIGDKFGRKESLAMSIMCMSLPTVIIGILPTYQSIGITATIVITITRILQGLSVGGNLTGSVSFLIEHSTEKTRGFFGSLPMSGLCIGILLGSLTSHLIKVSLTIEQFNEWGWRIPFLLGAPIVFVGIYIRYNIKETPIFEKIKKAGKISNAPLKKVLQFHWQEIVISIVINSTGSVIFYLEAVYLLNYLKIGRGFNEVSVDSLNKICCVIMAVVALLSGWVSDQIGRKRLYMIIIFIIIILTIPIIRLLEQEDFMLVAFSQVIIAILAAFYIGAEPALQAALYHDNIRNTALSLSYNISTSIFGGTSPIIFEYLVQTTKSLKFCAYYIILCAAISFIGLCFYKENSKITVDD